MTAASLYTLSQNIAGYFHDQAERYRLQPEKITVRYILNWGGFVNASFFVGDGKKTYHLKLSEGEAQTGLKKWMRVHTRLTGRYHAPHVVAWVTIPGTLFEGILSEAIPGQRADYIRQPDVLAGILKLLPDLHGDGDLARQLAELAPGGENQSCADVFCETYVRRFEEDLAGIRSNPPPFVTGERMDWMQNETHEMEKQVRALPAFQEAAVSPVHGDLGTNNILVTDSGDWYLIDWDDLSLGDPALDYALLLYPLWRNGSVPLSETEGYLPPSGSAFISRYRLCARALVLDEVIDSLADWVEAEVSPEDVERVRAEKERVHREGYELYQRLFAKDVRG